MREMELQIDQAPAKELLRPIREHADRHALAEFYRQRRDWMRYPLVHDHFVTYSIFQDLTATLPPETLRVLLPTAVGLAEDEVDELYLCAVRLVCEFSYGHESHAAPEGIRARLRQLRPRTQRLSLFPNMGCFWNQVATRIFPDVKDGSMLVRDHDWKQFISLDLPPVDDHGWQNCPGGENAVMQRVAGIQGGEFVLEYLRSAVYEGAKYWIWLYRNVSDRPIWHWYVLVVEKPDGSSKVQSHAMHTVVTLPPEELVVHHAFGLVR